MATKKKQPQLNKLSHPMQPIGFDDKGVVRFKQNKIVNALLDEKLDLNTIAVRMANGEFSKEDYTQLIQLVGYSVSGAGDLSEFDRKTMKLADAEADRIWKAANQPAAKKK